MANENIDYNKYIDSKEYDKFQSVIQSDINNRIKYGNKTGALVQDMLSVVMIVNANQDSIYRSDDIVMPNVSHYYEVLNNLSKRNEKFAKIEEEIIKVTQVIKIKQLQQSNIRQDLKQLSKLVKQLKDVESLECDLAFFELIINTDNANRILLRNLPK